MTQELVKAIAGPLIVAAVVGIVALGWKTNTAITALRVQVAAMDKRIDQYAEHTKQLIDLVRDLMAERALFTGT